MTRLTSLLRSNYLLVCAGFALLATGGAATAAPVAYPTAGATIEENFNTLSNTGSANAWTNGETPLAGWHGFSGATPFASYAANNGSAAQGLLLSVGSTSATDRALGSQSLTNSTSMRYGVAVSNDTGGTLSSFSLGYTGEQWRVIVTEGADSISVAYQIFNAGAGSLDAATGWTTINALAFTAPVTDSVTASNYAIDGNDPANRQVFAPVATAATWGAGQELWIRWTDLGASNRRAVMGIDDVSLSAVPEPAAVAVWAAVGGAAAASRRRRRC